MPSVTRRQALRNTLVVGSTAEPSHLALARIVVFGLIAWRVDTASLIALAELPAAVVDMPVGIHRCGSTTATWPRRR